MKVFKTFVFYPVVIGVLVGLASGHRLFAEHRGWWSLAIFFFAFIALYIPLVFNPYYDEIKKRKQSEKARAE